MLQSCGNIAKTAVHAQALGIWKDAGCPSEGELLDCRVEARRAGRRRVRECAAREEKRRIQKRERLHVSERRIQQVHATSMKEEVLFEADEGW